MMDNGANAYRRGSPEHDDPSRRLMRRHRLPLLALALAIAAGALCPASAGADGDPASDVLVTSSLFVPVDAGLSDAQRAKLSGLLSATQRAHSPIRVALIPTAFDLGAVTEFWLKPSAYARFLGVELSLVYKGPLLVVMPNGFGLDWQGHSTASASRLLAGIRMKPAGAGLLDAALAAIRVLAAGVRATAKTDDATEAHGGGGLMVTVAVIVVAALAIGAVGMGVRRRRRDTYAGRPLPVSRGALMTGLGWAAPAIVLLVAAVLIVHALAGRKRIQLPVGVRVTENTPYVYPGVKKAPNISLHDQEGQTVSLAAYRGHPVIVTFIDPLSHEPIPQAARVLSAVERALPAAQRPTILAVSVDVYGDTRAELRRDTVKWHVPTQWRWAVGSPKQLAATWKHYFAIVDVTSKRVAGSTVRSISASQMAYLIDAGGVERALFGWPYGIRELERALPRLEHS
jgi:cytochrome oxidase Cu insertion factor (SCO1/SenC/PrrC family)